jgi:hypothetical protein
MRHAVVRKKRNHPSIKKSNQNFSMLVRKRDYDMAAHVVYGCVLEVGGSDGIMRSLDAANSYLNRRRLKNVNAASPKIISNTDQ